MGFLGGRSRKNEEVQPVVWGGSLNSTGWRVLYFSIQGTQREISYSYPVAGCNFIFTRQTWELYQSFYLTLSKKTNTIYYFFSAINYLISLYIAIEEVSDFVILLFFIIDWHVEMCQVFVMQTDEFECFALHWWAKVNWTQTDNQGNWIFLCPLQFKQIGKQMWMLTV